MDKSTACHKLAEFNEYIDDLYDNLRDLEFELSICSDSEKSKFENKIERIKEKIEREEEKKEAFLDEYSDIIYS